MLDLIKRGGGNREQNDIIYFFNEKVAMIIQK